jgi:NAD(P)-dependent dehydrogenase (short-subunit alcohol dehydrogenase family)
LEWFEMNSTNKVAIITGASAGIGKATALALLNAGYAVALAGRREAELNAAVAQSGAVERALAVVTDVGDPASVKNLFDKTIAKFGRVDVLFNNAGIGAPPVDIDELSVEQWKAVVDTNLTGSFLCAREAFRAMKTQNPRGGRIINNGSISAYAPRPNSAPYTSTKHAISGLTKSIALDGRKYDIACSQIDIGNAATEMTERMAAGIMQANGTMAIEPRMDVQHVANSIVHIANLPLEANVLFMNIMATKMPFVGRG